MYVQIMIVWILYMGLSHSYHSLLFSTSKDIKIAVLTKSKKVYTIVRELNDGVAIDYIYNSSLVCWTDQGLEAIQCSNYNGTHTGNKVTYAKSGVIAPDGLAADWLTHKLYWTDAEANKIEVVSTDTKYRKVLWWQDLDQPRGIAVDPLSGLMFWTDWGEMPKIERASMDGNLLTREAIVTENLYWPNSISLNTVTQKLYWLDGKFKFIEVMNYDGKNRRKILENGISYPFAITILEDKIYWSDWETLSIDMFDPKGMGNAVKIIHGEYAPMDLKSWDVTRQPYKKTMCEENNGGCSHLCLLSYNPPYYTCGCPTGIRLIDNWNCANGTEHFLLLVQRSDISKISLDTPDHTSLPLPLKGIKHALGIDYDPVDKKIYWTDDESRNIRRVDLDGKEQEDLITQDILSPDGIAIDWVARNLYWSDAGTSRIEIASLNKKYRKVLIADDLGEPRAVAVSPEHGWLFWSDWYEKKPKIERSDLDGRNRMVLIKEGISWPNGIVLDYEESKLYWGDAKRDKIEVINMDGSNRREIITDNLPHIFGLTILDDYIYWTDWQKRSIDKALKHNGQKREVVLEQLPNVMGLKAVGPYDRNKNLWNPCKDGNCQQFCLNKPNNKYVCSCEIGYELNLDGVSCSKPDAYLLYALDEHVIWLSVTNVNSADVIPLSTLKTVSAIDVNILENRIYWADMKGKFISRAFMNGSHVEKIVESGLTSPDSLAVDWISGNLYWIDSGFRKIEVCRLDGRYRKTLFWNKLEDPKNLILDPREGYMFWTEWSKKSGSIIKATMDGSLKESIVKHIDKITGLTIDYGQRQLYWTQNSDEVASIQVSDVAGSNRRELLSQPNSKYFSIAQYQNLIYWTDWTNGTIMQTDKLTGRNTKIIHHQTQHISDLKVIHASKQTGWNVCADNNGKCTGLCLVRPGVSYFSTSQQCACPTHYELNNGSCIPPTSFILAAQRSYFTRILISNNDSPSSPLSTQGLKNVKAIEYDEMTKFIYWIDGKNQVIKRSYENSSHTSVVISGTGVGHTYNFYDMAIDPYNRLLFWSCSATDSINVTRLSNSSVGVVYKGIEGEKPRSISLHPEKSLLFWSDVGSNPRIIKARLDGQKRITVVQDVRYVESLYVDRMDNLIFFVAAGKIYRTDLEGNKKKILFSSSSSASRMTGITTMGGFLYWADREQQKIERMNKLTGEDRMKVVELLQPVDLVSVTPVTQSHVCSAENGHSYCSHFCVVSAANSSAAECSCPIGSTLSSEDNTSCSVIPICGKDFYTCTSPGGECIPQSWKCDGQTDCPDSSDEMGCRECNPHQFKCHRGECIDLGWVCDGTVHCPDGSDEAKCCSDEFVSAAAPYFQCVGSKDCISSSAVCDGWVNCSDGSDESVALCKDRNKSSDDSSREIVTIPLFLLMICLVASMVTLFKCKRRCIIANSHIQNEDPASRPLAPIKLQPETRISSSGGSSGNSGTLGTFSSTSVTCFPLNPPPSPATIIMRENNYCCQYLPPPPTPVTVGTPCSTDVCDESDYKVDSESCIQCNANLDRVSYRRNYKRNSKLRNVNDQYFAYKRSDSDRGENVPYPPPPTPIPRCPISDPPSPSSSTYFSPLPYPPPPSPTNSTRHN